ncbi:hypothetical protein TWF694_011300 [Orbilia ellipsospora]|uniref:Uncharacterized protein n=1 Tax=Orbilia ellipsospora TaxID=2528407 RepID=A0AAV9X4X1_9PEZI
MHVLSLVVLFITVASAIPAGNGFSEKRSFRVIARQGTSCSVQGEDCSVLTCCEGFVCKKVRELGITSCSSAPATTTMPPSQCATGGENCEVFNCCAGFTCKTVRELGITSCASAAAPTTTSAPPPPATTTAPPANSSPSDIISQLIQLITGILGG